MRLRRSNLWTDFENVLHSTVVSVEWESLPYGVVHVVELCLVCDRFVCCRPQPGRPSPSVGGVDAIHWMPVIVRGHRKDRNMPVGCTSTCTAGVYINWYVHFTSGGDIRSRRRHPMVGCSGCFFTRSKSVGWTDCFGDITKLDDGTISFTTARYIDASWSNATDLMNWFTTSASYITASWSRSIAWIFKHRACHVCASTYQSMVWTSSRGPH